jgi:hypothetical protein
MKICQGEAEFVLADRRTDGQAERQRDITKLIVAIRNFWKAL